MYCIAELCHIVPKNIDLVARRMAMLIISHYTIWVFKFLSNDIINEIFDNIGLFSVFKLINREHYILLFFFY